MDPPQNLPMLPSISLVVEIPTVATTDDVGNSPGTPKRLPPTVLASESLSTRRTATAAAGDDSSLMVFTGKRIKLEHASKIWAAREEAENGSVAESSGISMEESQSLSLKGVAGLTNLGSTCYMNSVLQCLAHTPELHRYFFQDYSNDIEPGNNPPRKLAIEFDLLLRRLRFSDDQPVSPVDFKLALDNVSTLFHGFEQQDSHELLLLLLEELHKGLKQVKKKSSVKQGDAGGQIDNETASDYGENPGLQIDSAINDTFQGHLKSMWLCPICCKVSQTFEPFYALILTLPAQKDRRSMTVTVYSGDGSAPPASYTVIVSSEGRCQDLIEAIGDACTLDSGEELLLLKIYGCGDFKPLEPLSAIKDRIEDNDMLAAYRLSKTCGKGILVILNRRDEVINSSAEVGEQWKPFCAPLLTCFSDENLVPSDEDLLDVVYKLFRPMEKKKNWVAAHSLKTEGKIPVSGAPQDELEMLIKPVSTKVKRYDAWDSKSNGSHLERSSSSLHKSLFRMCNMNGKGTVTEKSTIIVRYPIPMPAEFDRLKLLVLVDWSADALEQDYEMQKMFMTKPLVAPIASIPREVTKKNENAVSLYTYLDYTFKEKPSSHWCSVCTERQQAIENVNFMRLPPVVILHIDRTSVYYPEYRKSQTFVDFPVNSLDLSKYVADTSELEGYDYRLFAVINHIGSEPQSGHYTAYAKLVDKERWYEFDDSVVSEVNWTDIKTPDAFVLFYRRVAVKGVSDGD